MNDREEENFLEGSEDVDFEPEGELGDAAALKAKLKKVKDELESVKKERGEYLDGWQRCKADGINARRESLDVARREASRNREEFIHALLPALDSFDMAAGGPEWENLDASWRTGIENVRNQLLDALKRFGVTRFGKVGEPFDHDLHEALGVQDDVAGEPGTIVRVLRHGYRTEDRVLRPAHVFVKKMQ